jgi:putative FmdB family regulatory protein
VPSYDYECIRCGHVTTHRQVPVADRDEPRDCELCGEPARRLPVTKPGGFQLKGGGWYKDGYQGGGDGA